MNPLFISYLINQFRQIASAPNILNMPFDANEASKMRENIFSAAKSVEKDEPQVSGQLIRAKDILFYTNQFGQAMLNPFALGEVIFGLDYLTSRQTQGDGKEQECDFWAYIHPSIQKSSKKLYIDGHYANAAEDAFIEINDRVKHLFTIIKPGEKIPDGDKVMTTVFSANSPLIEFCNRNTQSGQNKQKGYMDMLSGAISALRNPKAHSNSEILSAKEAYRRLAVASMLMYAIDDAVKYSGIKE